jgi:putative nucleotide binding protein
MQNLKPRTPREENGIVLDFLPHGPAGSRERSPIAQVLGESHLVLLEVVPRKGISLQPGEKIYIGPEKREKVHHVAGRIPYSRLSQTAKGELDDLIEKIVEEKEAEYVKFYNTCGPISTRLHTLEILPGIGKKHMWDLINARKEKPFESFADIKKRVKLIPDPKQSIINRIMDEIMQKDKYRLFVG